MALFAAARLKVYVDGFWKVLLPRWQRKSKQFVFEDIAPLVTYIRISEAYFKGQKEALNGSTIRLTL